MLPILRSAEAVARDFVFETILDYAAPRPVLLDAPHDGDSHADAMRLAQSFRVLAVLLSWLIEHHCGRGEHCIAPGPMITRLLAAMGLGHRQLFAATAQLAVERRDSS